MPFWPVCSSFFFLRSFCFFSYICSFLSFLQFNGSLLLRLYCLIYEFSNNGSCRNNSHKNRINSPIAAKNSTVSHQNFAINNHNSNSNRNNSRQAPSAACRCIHRQCSPQSHQLVFLMLGFFVKNTFSRFAKIESNIFHSVAKNI